MGGAFCPRLFLGLLTIQAAVHFLKVQAAVKTVRCQSQKYQAGEIVSTKPGIGIQKTYCGSDTGWFYAVDNNLLFHLQCTSSAPASNLAKVTLINMKNKSNRESTFDPQVMCDIYTLDYGRQRPTVNAHLIAKKLEGHWVPYHLNGCNGRDYVNYLADGQVTSPSLTSDCPLRTTFKASTNVNGKFSGFRLSSQEGRYNWPQSQGRSRSPRRRSNDSGAVLTLSPSSKGKSYLPNPMQMFNSKSSRSSSSRQLATTSSEKYKKTPDIHWPKSRKHRHHHNDNDTEESAGTRSARPFWRLLGRRRK
ncbi:unnamed protein product [Bemisia tabaci]|uniref:Uncharacterized protein n=1 Tax=Bemisia tabaci TaxID=7038 RepID=A0A9P0FZD9_BEMTA|nr:unnamed protein product [Bemisia tabaci]